MTIADCAILQQLRALRNGTFDGVPKTIVDGFPNLVAFYDRIMAIPAVAAHYAQ